MYETLQRNLIHNTTALRANSFKEFPVKTEKTNNRKNECSHNLPESRVQE
jgi:hypothetical protein